MREKFEQLLQKYGFDELEMENAINFVADLLEFHMEYLKEVESDAYVSIEKINQAITEVNSLIWLDEFYEEQ